MRHKGVMETRLRGYRCQSRLLWRFRSVWRLRFDLRGRKIEFETCRRADSLPRTHLRRHKHSTLEARLAAAQNGGFRGSAAQIRIDATYYRRGAEGAEKVVMDGLTGKIIGAAIDVH